MPRRLAPVALGLLLTACIGGADTDSVQVGDPEWYTSCGDPACSGWTATDGVDLCTSQVEGDACEDLESRCDPQNFKRKGPAPRRASGRRRSGPSLSAVERNGPPRV